MTARTPFYKNLGALVLISIAIGIFVGWWSPASGIAMKPLGDGFIKLIKMLIAPIIFCTVVVGIAGQHAMKDVGRIGVRALLYFEAVSTVALVLGLVMVNLIQPGSAIGFQASAKDVSAVSGYTAQAQLTTTQFLLNIIPTTVVDAFAKGDLLPVLFFSVLLGMALLTMKERARPLVGIISQFSHALFGIVGMIMWAAPLGAFGAMAYTIGQFGIGSLWSLGKLMAGVYATCALFVFVVLGMIMRYAGLSVVRLLRYLKEEIMIVLGTSSSETALPKLMVKLEHLGCRKSVVGLVVPTGYSFNLDGTAIYMTMAALFVAEAGGVHLSIGQQFSVLLILMITSKGAAGVTGSGLITLAATLSAIPTIPIAGLALLVGVDRFMSQARSITNFIGNSVATVVIAKWDGALDLSRAKRVLNGEAVDALDTMESMIDADTETA